MSDSNEFNSICGNNKVQDCVQYNNVVIKVVLSHTVLNNVRSLQ